VGGGAVDWLVDPLPPIGGVVVTVDWPADPEVPSVSPTFNETLALQLPARRAAATSRARRGGVR
jgi:hypothetical protein